MGYKESYRFWPEDRKKKHDQYRRDYYQRGQDNASNSRNRWSDLEIDILINIHVPDPELSKLLGRSCKAIERKRDKLRKEGIIK